MDVEQLRERKNELDLEYKKLREDMLWFIDNQYTDVIRVGMPILYQELFPSVTTTAERMQQVGAELAEIYDYLWEVA